MTYFILAVFKDMPKNQSLTGSSVVQAKLLACCYGFMSEFVTSADIILL